MNDLEHNIDIVLIMTGNINCTDAIRLRREGVASKSNDLEIRTS